MPWATLELDPTDASERDVKRAYAKRLKTCRPDQDPEGFRKLHEAYTSALAELQWRGGGPMGRFEASLEGPEDESGILPLEETGPPLQAQPLSATTTAAPVLSPADPSPARRAITEAFDRLETAIAGNEAGVSDLVRAAESALYEHPAEVQRWGELMYDLIAKRGTHPDLRLKPGAMLFELEHGGAGATLAIIERLDRDGSPQGIANLANLLLQNTQRIANPGAGVAAARLAGAAAFWVRRHAAPLADFAYQHLARGERDFHMQLIDRHESMGKLLYTVPDRFKSYWRQRIMHTPGKDAWDDEESREALHWLNTSTLRGSQVREVLTGLLPEEVAATLHHRPSAAPRVGEGSSSSGAGEALRYEQGSATSGARTPRSSTSSAGKDRTPAWDRDPAGSRPRQRQRSHQTSGYNYQNPRASGGSNIPVRVILWGLVVIAKVLFLSAKCSGGY